MCGPDEEEGQGARAARPSLPGRDEQEGQPRDGLGGSLLKGCVTSTVRAHRADRGSLRQTPPGAQAGHSGLRLSRNAAMPSRASGVCEVMAITSTA